MSNTAIASVRTWLAEPMGRDVSEAVDRLRHAPDVQHIAVMPDVHLAADVCIGVVVATSRLIYPQAVGGDIGCGMLAVAFDVEARALDDARKAMRILAELGKARERQPFHRVAGRRRGPAVADDPQRIAGDGAGNS